eukprot:6189059-Pleurochrysis_carterae.AAC.1
MYEAVQPAPALPASDSRAAPNAAAVDAGIAVLEVVRVLVGLEKQRPPRPSASRRSRARQAAARRFARARWPSQRALRASQRAWPCASPAVPSQLPCASPASSP